MGKSNSFISHISKRIDYSAGKKFFGNTAGFRNNVSGKLKMNNGPVTNTQYTKQVQELQTKGFLKLGCPHTETLIETIREKYVQMIEDDKYSYASSQYEGKVYARNIRPNPFPIPEIANLFTDELKQIFKELYHGNFQIRRVTPFRIYHIPPELRKKTELFSNNWHCDARNTDLWKLFILLSDVKEDNGPLHFQTLERTKELIKMGFGGRANYDLDLKVIEDPNHVTKLTGKPGTTMIGNTELCIHRAGDPAPGKTRDMIIFQLEPSSEPLRDDWIEHPDLNQKYN